MALDERASHYAQLPHTWLLHIGLGRNPARKKESSKNNSCIDLFFVLLAQLQKRVCGILVEMLIVLVLFPF